MTTSPMLPDPTQAATIQTNTQPATASLPIACSLGPDDLRDRRRLWRDLAQTALRKQLDTDGGVRLEYAAHDGVARTLRELVALEQQCCAWANWNLSDDDDLVVLEVTTRLEAVTALQTMFQQP